ncbi:MAG TPA: hypothetical protein VF193_01035 [Steroidobacter sp.]
MIVLVEQERARRKVLALLERHPADRLTDPADYARLFATLEGHA